MLSRRDTLKLVTAITASAVVPSSLGCAKEEVPPPTDPVFGHGVASGDPLPNAVILWTKVTTKEPVTGRWEMSRDATFANIAAHGDFVATAERDFTVKIDATGLEPGTTYFYRFIALGVASPIGRTRTAPLDAKALRFAVVSCASLPHGFFHVYRAIAQRPDIDAVVHLGDYIYEYADGDYGKVRKSEPEHAVQTLADYRTRYAQYRRDRDLQEAHRQHPFICIWDDHEVVDNAWRDGTTGDNDAVGPWPERTLAAKTAYSEWIPIRDQPDGKIWRTLRYGNLAELLLLDTRLWGRDIQLPPADPGLANPARQILGADQETWLGESLRTSTARWKLVCQQVMMTSVPSWFRDDGWDDYPAARDRFYDVLEKTPVNDVVVLSGDVHSSWASDLARVPSDPAVYDPVTGQGSLAVELIAPAITSPGNETKSADSLTAEAAWLKYIDLERRGFILLDVTETKAHASWFHVEDVEDEDGLEATFSKGFSTLTGENRLRPELDPPPRRDAAPLAPEEPELLLSSR
jgi:alkaline phosphatase D